MRAVVKLNRLIHRRAQQPRRRGVTESVNHIDSDDLVDLKAWSHKHSYVKRKDDEGIALPFTKLAATDLPTGFGFDKFGLIIRKSQQQQQQQPDNDLAIWYRRSGNNRPSCQKVG
jgi:hypothetical protein